MDTWSNARVADEVPSLGRKLVVPRSRISSLPAARHRGRNRALHCVERDRTGDIYAVGFDWTVSGRVHELNVRA